MPKNSIKVVSLVPSITETLIECGVNLVGRSRFCIHPQPLVNQISKVGGTKDVDWEKVKQVAPDIVILDKEENTKEMAASCPVEYFALHIQNVDNVGIELLRLAKRLDNEKLAQIAERWQMVNKKETISKSLTEFPGVIEWWKNSQRAQSFIYLIWKDPWMAAGENIFIQSMLDKLGYRSQRIEFKDKYPQINLGDYSPESTLLLFSSEPFPFANYRDQMEALGYDCALIDGEKFSWYGIRSLEFLEQELFQSN